MSKLVFVLLVFLLSLHACNARHLSSADQKIDTKSHIISKDVLSRKLRSFFVHSEPTVVQTQEHSSTSTNGADELVNTVMGKVSTTVILNEDEKKGEVAISFSEETSQRENWRQARSPLQSSPNEVEETANSEDNDAIDDVVSMDYAKPHRKPPIHNRKI